MHAAFRSIRERAGYRVYVRLKRKLANVLNGIDVSHVKPGGVLELSNTEAEMMIREGWAEPADARPSADSESPLPKPPRFNP